MDLCELFLVLCIAGGASTQAPHRIASECFHVKGVPTIKLKCPASELIQVNAVFYGAPRTGVDDGLCEYNDGSHCIQLADIHDNCMGRYMCSVYVSNPFLMNCRTYATYMQVNYTCVPRFSISNMCDVKRLTTSLGYLSSPRYPDANYTHNLRCECQLITRDAGIVLHLLDFSVNHTSSTQCDGDFLKLGTYGRKCGQIGPERLPERIDIDSQTVTLEFNTDRLFSNRGFWLQFKGWDGGPVSLSCGAAIAPIFATRLHTSSPVDTNVPNIISKPGLTITRHNGDNNISPETQRGTKTHGTPMYPLGRTPPGDFKASMKLLQNDDTVYDPSLGPADLPGQKSYGDNVVLNGDWNNNFIDPIHTNSVLLNDDAAILNGSVISITNSTSLDIIGGPTFDERESRAGFPMKYSVGTGRPRDANVQVITGVVVGVLILVAVIIIIFLVFRRT